MKISDQKLIYSGQLLNDTTCLKDVLRQYDTTEEQSFTMHLICASHNSCTERLRNEDSSPSLKMSASETVANDTRQERFQSHAVNSSGTESSPSMSPQFYGQLNGQQIAWMQEAYTRYLTQYMQYMTAQGIQLQGSVPYIQPTNANPTEAGRVTPLNNNNVDNEQQPRLAAQDAVEANPINNNLGGDDLVIGLHRDWLDFFYVLSRIVILFSIVFFYSSPLRFLIVTFLGFAIYLYQGGFFRVQPILLDNNGRVENNNQVLQNEAQVMPQQQQAAPAGMQAEARTNGNNDNEEERPGPLAFTWTFFRSFFTSLFPDQPNVI
ncbi:homocysteine-responsive endoplasmic reticulum-resident ubiquitin-like domain member 2 protein isoform X2 [Orussus abietinus]|uniref:homocysteine-responsive endoplasmic reticulum-resident ubiquitin-like domain member 2 protein isoform X2 n=1 Tax=Orussus abietinus TaxID=222816 RepID=UPI000C715CAC|nr:homocysteine-responsive endoplasmic reticulum-resident ubiquitin-like domain member 2 protein isoform X2 [Orussus abietinus]